MRLRRLTRILVGILFCGLIHNPAAALAQPSPTNTYDLTLAWNPSPSPEIVHCNLYYGTASGEYTDIIVVGNVASVTISNLVPGVTYYFAITAVNAEGQESDFSNEASYRQEPTQVQSVQLQIHSSANGSMTLHLTGPPSHTCEIEATEDFTTWTVIGTVTLNAGGALDFIDPDAANFPQRFYRTRDSQSGPQSLPPPQLQIHRAPDAQIMLSATGPAGHTYDIQATEDFVTWTVIATVTLGDGGPADFTDTNAPNFSQRFYRLAEHPPSQPNITPAQIQLRGMSGGQLTMNVSGPAGHTYDIEATEDFVNWTVIGTVTLDAGGSLDFTDTNAMNFLTRFYRLVEHPPSQQSITPAQIQARGMSDGQFTLAVSGIAGHTYVVEATADFLTWTIIGTVTLDAGGSLDFTDRHAANYPQRFYRTRDPQP